MCPDFCKSPPRPFTVRGPGGGYHGGHYNGHYHGHSTVVINGDDDHHHDAGAAFLGALVGAGVGTAIANSNNPASD